MEAILICTQETLYGYVYGVEMQGTSICMQWSFRNNSSEVEAIREQLPIYAVFNTVYAVYCTVHPSGSVYIYEVSADRD